MKFRLQFESLETRENPSGPDLLDPTAPTGTTPPSQPPAQTQPAPAPTDPVVDPALLGH